MPAPEILSFGDGAHEAGETGLTIDGGGFGAFPGSVWIFQNSDRSGAADELTVGSWNDIQLSGVSIPSSLNNLTGTRYLAVQREDLAWSQTFAFNLITQGISATGVLSISADADPSGAGRLDSSGVLAFTSDASVHGAVENLAAVAALSISGSGALRAIGELSCTGSISTTSSAALLSPGSIVASGAMSVLGSPTLDAIGELVAVANLKLGGNASLGPIGSQIIDALIVDSIRIEAELKVDSVTLVHVLKVDSVAVVPL